ILTERARQSEFNRVEYGALTGTISTINDRKSLCKLDSNGLLIPSETTQFDKRKFHDCSSRTCMTTDSWARDRNASTARSGSSGARCRISEATSTDSSCGELWRERSDRNAS